MLAEAGTHGWRCPVVLCASVMLYASVALSTRTEQPEMQTNQKSVWAFVGNVLLNFVKLPEKAPVMDFYPGCHFRFRRNMAFLEALVMYWLSC